MFESIYFARQPILDIDGHIFAYELLYRDSLKQNFPPIKDDRLATAQVLVNALNLVTLKDFLGDALAFINIDRDLLLDEMLLSIPKENFILEILETVKVDEEVIQRIKELKALGYHFALDDADCTKEYVLNFQAIFQYIDILKLDITTLDKEQLPQFLSLFKNFNMKILAEKVETQEEFDEYKNYGSNYFQGYFFAKPDIVENKRLDPKQLFILHMIRKLQENCEIDEIARQFEQDVALTLQLLRFINSAAFSFRSSIKSIRQAIMLLGPNQLKSWLLLISYANSKDNSSGIQNPLLQLAQTRSNMMQTLAKVSYKEKITTSVLEQAAFIGLLSLVEVLFQVPLEDILHELHVDQEIIDILVLQEGKLGTIFKLVREIEVFNIQKIETLKTELAINSLDFSEAVLEAYAITESFIAELKA